MDGHDLPLMEVVEALGNPYLLRVPPQVCMVCGGVCTWWLIQPPEGPGEDRQVLGKFCDEHAPQLKGLAHAQE